MDTKPKKPRKKLFGRLKPLDDAVAKSKNTPADTKALETATRELSTATTALGAAMEKSYTSFDKAYKMTADMAKSPAVPAPVPIPYPVISKLEKETKGAVQTTDKALKKHDKAYKKLIQVIDKQIKVLKPAAKKSNSEEAATLKGLVSAKTTGKAQWAQFALDVKLEAKNVVIHFDKVTKNHQ